MQNTGSLPPVHNLSVTPFNTTYILVSWNAPFSLRSDTTYYCVDVVDNSSSLVVSSECGITDTMQAINLQVIACSLFNVTVTPVNAVGNGTALSVVQNFLDEGKQRKFAIRQ